jgi:hypothetical protein
MSSASATCIVTSVRGVPGVLAAFALSAALVGCTGSGGRAVQSTRSARTPLRACKVGIAGMPRSGSDFAFGGGLAAELPDGSLVVGASRFRGSKLSIVLRRVTRDCRVVRQFGEHGTATVSVKSRQFGEIAAMVATRDGQLLLAGTDGRRELVGRLLASGRLDRSFGQDGWTRLRPHEKPLFQAPSPVPLATSIAIGPSGSIFLGGDDQEAHCCVQDFVSALTARGAPVQGFGRSGSIILPATFQGSYATDVFVDAGGSLYAHGQVVFMGCGGPVIVRIRPDGSLDSRFDSAVARSLRSLTPHHLLFSPALVLRQRPGTFALIGGLATECPPVAHPTSGGLAVGMLPSGRIDRSYGRRGQTRFPSPAADAFDHTSAIRLPSGGFLAATEVYSATTSALTSVIVRAFSSNGSIDRAFGKSGARTIGLRTLPRTAYSSVALVRAADGDAWIVIGLPKETDLIPILAST